MKQVQYFGISENKSASTLYHPTTVISIPKAKRKSLGTKDLLTEHSKLVTLPPTLNTRATSFGYGYKNS